MSISVKSSKRDLLKLPTRALSVDKVWYRSLLIIPTRQKHDSGWAQIAIIGCDGDDAIEIIAWPDDIQWPKNDGWSWRTDAYWPAGVLRLWSHTLEFSVDYPSSSTEIESRPRTPQPGRTVLP